MLFVCTDLGLSQVSAKRSVRLLKDEAEKQAEREAAARKAAEEQRAIAAYLAKKQALVAPPPAAASKAKPAAAASAPKAPEPAPVDDSDVPPLETVM